MVDLFKFARASAERMSVEPLWLKSGTQPDFKVVEPGGVGPELLLLHGLFGALSNWDSVLPLMTPYCKPVALGFPIVTAHRSDVKVKSLAVYSEYFLRMRNIQPVAICGNSLGGHVALRLCLSSPELVDCLILTGTSGLYEHTVDALPIRPDHRFIREHMARVFYDSKYATEHAINEIYEIIKVRANVLNIIHAARSAKKDNLETVLPQIKTPTLLLWGEEDEVTTMDIAHEFHRLIPGSELHTIKGCGHAPMIEKPEWFSEQVACFLKKHSKLHR